LVPIEKIRIGDEVRTRNIHSGKLEYKKVTALTAPHLDQLLEIKIAGEKEALRPTPSHPFWTRRGNSQATWIKAREMHVGDQVLTLGQHWVKVNAIKTLEGQQTVYNFEVGGDHDYFVGKVGELVHNIGSCAFGQATHQNFLDTLIDQTGTDAEDWIMRTDPGQTGVDAEYVGTEDIGFKYAELKSDSVLESPGGLNGFGNQLTRWNLLTSQTSLWLYDGNGVISFSGYIF
jgi:hypothetical protein